MKKKQKTDKRLPITPNPTLNVQIARFPFFFMKLITINPALYQKTLSSIQGGLLGLDSE
jgi:hypothetical protein